MYGWERSRGLKNTALWMDWIHIVIGTLIVLMAIIAFLNPESNMMLFPVIFMLAAALNLLNGVYRCRRAGREKKKIAAGMGQIAVGSCLAVVTLISAVSIWR